MLDTLYELSNALGNDPNFAATMTNLIGTKLPSADVVNVAAANKVLRLDANAKMPFGALSGLPTTLGGYGISDAYTKLQSDEKFAKILNPAFGGNASITNEGVFTNTGGNTTLALKNSSSANGDTLLFGWLGEDKWGIQSADQISFRDLHLQPFGGTTIVGSQATANALSLQVGSHYFYNAGDSRPANAYLSRSLVSLYLGGTNGYSYGQRLNISGACAGAGTADDKSNARFYFGCSSDANNHANQSYPLTITGENRVGAGGVTEPLANLHSTGTTILGAPASGYPLVNPAPNHLTFYVNEANNLLAFYYKKTNGTVWQGTISLYNVG